ncbi:MAG: precorrin-8X methylmutase [bacterium]
MKKALLLLGHGSRIQEANESLYSIAEMVKKKSGLTIVKPVFLQFASPTLLEGIEYCLAQGVEEILIHPYFLYAGAHVLQDIPAMIESFRSDHPGVRIRITSPLGVHDKLAEIVLERLKENGDPGIAIGEPGIGEPMIGQAPDLAFPDQTLSGQPLCDQILSEPALSDPDLCDPALIERKSFAIISNEIQEDIFPEPLRPIVKRVIHATGDVTIASAIRFSPHFYQHLSESLSGGAPIITDVFMVKEGLSLPLLARFNNPVFCFIRDDEVRETAEKEKITRSMAALRKGAALYPEGIYLVGNAPTALRELIHLYRRHEIAPAGIVGCPVGFVGAAEAKEELCQTDLSYFTCLGPKGGSPMAAAVINALLKELP